jgi:L-ribulose-5-phosphate 3-epimerase
MNKESQDLSRRSVLAGGMLLAVGGMSAASASGAMNSTPGQPSGASGTPGTPSSVPPVQSGGAEPSKLPRTLRAAVMYGMIGDGTTVAEKFQVIKDAGFEGVEMESPTEIPMAEILEAATKTGIIPHGVVNGLHWRVPLNAPDVKARAKATDVLKQVIRDAKALGSTSVLLVPAVVSAKQPYDLAWELASESIRDCMSVAKECNITIAVENVWNNFLLSPLEAARFVDQFGEGSKVAWHFDIGNIINFGFPDQWVKVLGNRIVKLHIKDFSRKKRDDEGLWKGFDVQIGEGDANWPAVMKALDATGYSTAAGGNWATAEVGGGDVKRLTQIREQMARVFAA